MFLSFSTLTVHPFLLRWISRGTSVRRGKSTGKLPDPLAFSRRLHVWTSQRRRTVGTIWSRRNHVLWSTWQLVWPNGSGQYVWACWESLWGSLRSWSLPSYSWRQSLWDAGSAWSHATRHERNGAWRPNVWSWSKQDATWRPFLLIPIFTLL